MKYIFPILAFFILLKPFSPYAEYLLNYEYISEVLCENKDRPKLECDGKCYLMKSLAEASDEGSETKDFPLKKLDFQLLYFNKDKGSSDRCQIAYKSGLTMNSYPYPAYCFLMDGQRFRPPIYEF